MTGDRFHVVIQRFSAGTVFGLGLIVLAVACGLATGIAAQGNAARRERAVQALDRRIPPPDREKNGERWKAEWRNPRIVVDLEKMYLLVGGSAYTPDTQPVEDLRSALHAVDLQHWPEGRIVSIALAPRSQAALRAANQDAVRVRQMLDHVKEVLSLLEVEYIDTPVGCNC